jgi:hypothetical protein
MQCASFKPSDIVMHPYVSDSDANGDNVYEVKRISSLSDHHSSRTQGGSLTATYKVFSIGVGACEYSADSHHSERRYIDADAVTLGGSFTLNGGEPSRDALRKLASGRGVSGRACRVTGPVQCSRYRGRPPIFSSIEQEGAP